MEQDTDKKTQRQDTPTKLGGLNNKFILKIRDYLLSLCVCVCVCVWFFVIFVVVVVVEVKMVDSIEDDSLECE